MPDGSHCIPGQLCSRSGVLVLTGWRTLGPQSASQPVVTSTRGFGATASKVSVVDRPGVLPRLSSIGNLTGVNTGYYCVSICNYLSLTLNSYFHHNQTRPRTKNYKNTKWIFDWINHRPAEFTSILGNDKNLKEDLILGSKNYKIIFEIQSGEPSPDWVVLSGSGSRAALMIETFLSRSIAFLQHWGAGGGDGGQRCRTSQKTSRYSLCSLTATILHLQYPS